MQAARRALPSAVAVHPPWAHTVSQVLVSTLQPAGSMALRSAVRAQCAQHRRWQDVLEEDE
eukprot:5629474-Pyramimonas_sp.AAC.1